MTDVPAQVVAILSIIVNCILNYFPAYYLSSKLRPLMATQPKAKALGLLVVLWVGGIMLCAVGSVFLVFGAIGMIETFLPALYPSLMEGWLSYIAVAHFVFATTASSLADYQVRRGIKAMRADEKRP
jgi:hypothetical protein